MVAKTGFVAVIHGNIVKSSIAGEILLERSRRVWTFWK